MLQGAALGRVLDNIYEVTDGAGDWHERVEVAELVKLSAGQRLADLLEYHTDLRAGVAGLLLQDDLAHPVTERVEDVAYLEVLLRDMVQKHLRMVQRNRRYTALGL